MIPSNFTDEELMAFADGEASAKICLEIETALPSDPALAARVAMFSSTRSLVKQSAPLQPLPDGLEAKIRAMAAKPANVLPFPAQVKAANSNLGRWQLPLAASVALAIGLSGGYFASNRLSAGKDGLELAGLVDPALADALQTVPSGSGKAIGENLFKAIASFRNGSGQLCREFEKDFKSGAFVVGVACRENGRWATQAMVASARSDAGYAPASSMDAIEAYISAIGADTALSATEEAAALNAEK